ncbi:MAG: hypothetical protein LBS67_01850 [Clostridiales Family XIII bacterium]|jgi:hypothetical protein|nr:hypothetical protein [Clostridiales Family XIII bacterium]
MDKNKFGFGVIEPDYEPLTEREESRILEAALAKAGGAADSIVGADAQGSASANSLERSSADRRFAKTATRRSRGRRGGRVFAIALVAVLAFGAVAFASTVIDPDSPLLALFDPPGGQLSDDEVKLAQASGTVIDKVVEKDGLKIHVKEAIGDRDTVYLLFDVTPLKGVTEPGAEYGFERLFLEPKGIFASSSYGSAGWSYSYSKPSDDGTISFIACLNADGGVQGKTFILSLENLLRMPAEDTAGTESTVPDESVAVAGDAASFADRTEPEGDEKPMSRYSQSESGDASGSSSGEAGNGISVTREGEGIVVKDDDGTVLYEGTETGASVTDDGNGIVVKDAAGNILYAENPAEDADASGDAETGATTSEDGEPVKTVLEGKWEITFKLDYKDNSRDLDVSADVGIDGSAYRLKDVRISPVSLSYTLVDKTKASTGKEGFLHDAVERDLPLVIKLKDGSKYDSRDEGAQGAGGMAGDSSTYKFNTQFPRIIDPMQIESILFGDYEVKL